MSYLQGVKLNNVRAENERLKAEAREAHAIIDVLSGQIKQLHDDNAQQAARLKEAMNDLQEGAVIIVAYRAENERLATQLELSAKAWKEWEGTLKQRDNEIAHLRTLLRGVVREADRETNAFIAARAALKENT
jgi:chromosome segregation ATPase